MKKVLFVDDEIQILKALNRIFIDAGYELFFAESANKALKILEDNTVDMIVSDMRMPGMDGIELLKIVKKKYPDIIRIILSGFADEHEVMHTLQNNISKAYMFKPWNNEELLNIVKQNLFNKTNLPHELTTYINNMEKLPTIKERYGGIRDAIKAEKNILYLVSEIEKDPTISAKVLQIANSAFYGKRTGSLSKALTFIGTNELENILLSMEIMEQFVSLNENRVIVKKIWNHSYFTNKIQHTIQSYFLHKVSSHTEITAGLLHKIGIVFMIMYYGDTYAALLKESLKNNQFELNVKEKEKYGFTHPELSAYILKWWNAPDQIVESSAFYQSPFNATICNKEIVSIIHIAQHYACLYFDDAPFCDFYNETFDYLGMDKDDFEANYRKLLSVWEAR